MSITGTKIIEQRVNTTTALGPMGDTNITTLSNGNWVVTWSSRGDDGAQRIYQRVYDASGNAFSDESVVDTIASGMQPYHNVTALSGGGWVVTWSGGADDYDVHQQRYDENGVAQGAATLVNTHTAGFQLWQDVTALTDGGWVVTWASYLQDGSEGGVYQQRYHADGTTFGGEVRVNSTTDGDQTSPHIAALKDGGWVVAWASPNASGSYEVVQQRFNADGSPQGGETPVDGPLRPYQQELRVTGLQDGGWVVIWTQEEPGGDGGDIYQQRYDSSGVAQGPAEIVNASTNGQQDDPNVVALSDGGWLVVWRNMADEGLVYLQRYDSSGIKQGGEEKTSLTATNTYSIGISTLPGGGWVLAAKPSEVYAHSYIPLTEARLTVHAEHLTGDGAGDIFEVELDGLSAGDVIDAGGGEDILKMVQAGTMNLTKPTTLIGFEAIVGSDGDDIILTNLARLSGITSIDGGSGTDKLKLLNDSYDLRGMVISNIEQIQLYAGGSVRTDSKATALLVRGILTPETAVEVTLEGASFTAAEKAQLFRQGVVTIKDDDGVYTNAAPDQLFLSPRSAEELAPTGTLVGQLTGFDPNPDDTLTYKLLDDAGGRFALGADGVSIVVANGLKLDYEQSKSHTITVQVTDQAGLSFEKTFTVSVVDVAREVASGSDGADSIVGGAGNDRFFGKAGNDTLIGGAGADTLYGGLGKDSLSGSSGKDVFVFDTAVAKKKNTNIDKIVKFSVKDDSIWLENSIFKGLGKKGTPTKPAQLSKDLFYVGAKAHDASDRIIYNKQTGALFYDEDGTGAKAAIQIAILDRNIKDISAKDFFII